MADFAVPILPSRYLHATLAFYERLGFENAGAPPDEWDYMIIRRNGAELHFYLDPNVDPLTTPFTCYVFTENADALYAEWKALGIPADPTTGSRLHPISDMEYGMRQSPSSIRAATRSPSDRR